LYEARHGRRGPDPGDLFIGSILPLDTGAATGKEGQQAGPMALRLQSLAHHEKQHRMILLASRNAKTSTARVPGLFSGSTNVAFR
jgi:hypothetical protein